MPKLSKTFTATLEHLGPSLGWTIARVPFDPSIAWPKMIRLRIRGEINGHPFRTSLFPSQPSGFFLLVNKTMQQGAHAHLGDTATFTLEPDLEPREAELPDELAVLLDEEPGLRTWYDSLTEYTRRYIGKWIADVKTDTARMNRCQQIAERLLNTMEAEIELPPMIAEAFRKNAKARVGWQRMTPTQRRNELMAVFYYQTPEARAKRLQKVIDEAAKRAE